jgi:hypothetical protein
VASVKVDNPTFLKADIPFNVNEKATGASSTRTRLVEKNQKPFVTHSLVKGSVMPDVTYNATEVSIEYTTQAVCVVEKDAVTNVPFNATENAADQSIRRIIWKLLILTKKTVSRMRELLYVMIACHRMLGKGKVFCGMV